MRRLLVTPIYGSWRHTKIDTGHSVYVMSSANVVIAQQYFTMSETNVSDDEESPFQGKSSSGSSSDTNEDYLDLLAELNELNDFQECSTIPQWQRDKQKDIEKLIDDESDTSHFRGLCFHRGGLLNGNTYTRSFF